MDLYTLKFAADGSGERKNVLIEAMNDGEALILAEELAGGRPAELYAGSKRLFSLSRRSSGINRTDYQLAED